MTRNKAGRTMIPCEEIYEDASFDAPVVLQNNQVQIDLISEFINMADFFQNQHDNFEMYSYMKDGVTRVSIRYTTSFRGEKKHEIDCPLGELIEHITTGKIEDLYKKYTITTKL